MDHIGLMYHYGFMDKNGIQTDHSGLPMDDQNGILMDQNGIRSHHNGLPMGQNRFLNKNGILMGHDGILLDQNKFMDRMESIMQF